MGFYDQCLSDSPVVVLQPQQPMQRSYNMNAEARSPSSFCLQMPQSETPSAGRKRSRDEAADNLEDDSYFPPATETMQESEEDWEYREGMALIKPNGFIIDASSHMGTWAEEKAEISQLQTPVAQIPPGLLDRPNLRSHKSLRLNLTATPVIDEEKSTSNGALVAQSPPKIGLEDPTIDAFTIHLGIGWSLISGDEHIQAAARGWAKFIENHYPVSSVQIRLQSKGLASYLVEANEGWFLFGEDLKEGRLVSTFLDKTFENLRTSPPVFDGDKVFAAFAETPRPDAETKLEVIMAESDTLFSVPEVLMNEDSGIQGPKEVMVTNNTDTPQDSDESHLEVEMDMS